MPTISYHTVVQHSGYGYKGDPQFIKGLESRTVDTRATLDRVKKAGGVLFHSYAQAEDYCMEEMYRTAPPGAFTLTPQAPGEFSDRVVDGLRIYVPPVRPEGAV